MMMSSTLAYCEQAGESCRGTVCSRPSYPEAGEHGTVRDATSHRYFGSALSGDGAEPHVTMTRRWELPQAANFTDLDSSGR